MSLKKGIALCLEKSKGSFVSGGDLAEQFCVSRSAVSKAVKALRLEGYDIEAVTNRGYRLPACSDILSAEGIKPHLKGSGLNITVVDSTGSTNSDLKKAALDGLSENNVLIAREQTGGRGRMGREFFSPKGTGIYMSLLLRPKMPAKNALNLTTAAAVAVARAIEKVCGVEPKIKWVNDIFVGSKKVCGILTEAAVNIETGGVQYAVVGIGVNVEEPKSGFPKDLKGIAAALTNSAGFKNSLAAEILNEFYEFYNNGELKGEFYNEYRSRLFILGKRVEVMKNGEVKTALACDISPDFCLLVEYDDGTSESLSSGEVRLRLYEEN